MGLSAAFQSRKGLGHEAFAALKKQPLDTFGRLPNHSLPFCLRAGHKNKYFSTWVRGIGENLCSSPHMI